MERIDKINFAAKTLKYIRQIYDKGFKKSAHPDIWNDLTKMVTRIDMLIDILETDSEQN